MQYLDLPLDQIYTQARLRAADPAKVAELANSIALTGLTNPITVAPAESSGYYKGQHKLIAGLHRLQAITSLGWQTIPALTAEIKDEDTQRLVEIHENLARAELTAFDRARFLFEAKQLYERLNPAAKWGGDYRWRQKQANTDTFQSHLIPSADQNSSEASQNQEDTRQEAHDGPLGNVSQQIRTNAFLAEKTKLSEKTVKRDLALYKKLAPLQKDISGTALAHDRKALSALAKLYKDSKAQRKLLNQLLGAGGANTTLAPRKLTQAPTKPNPLATIRAAIAELDDQQRNSLFLQLTEEYQAEVMGAAWPLFEQGKMFKHYA